MHAFVAAQIQRAVDGSPLPIQAGRQQRSSVQSRSRLEAIAAGSSPKLSAIEKALPSLLAPIEQDVVLRGHRLVAPATSCGVLRSAISAR